MIAPQLGLFGGMPPKTDNPAACVPVPCPAQVRQRIRELRAEFVELSRNPATHDPVNQWYRAHQAHQAHQARR